MTRILALETATGACSAALWWDGECREELRLTANRHAEVLIPMAQELLDRTSHRYDDLDALAFGSGPGSFTGLRIAIAVTQGLALAAGCPVVPVSSLLAIAARVDAPRVLAAIDARMSQVYWNVYRMDPATGCMQALQEPRVGFPADVRLPEAGEWIAAGSGCDAYRDALSSAGPESDVTFISGVHPHAGDIARIAAREYAAGNAVNARDAAPDYVRNEIVQRR